MDLRHLGENEVARWTEFAAEHLQGKTVFAVRYLTPDEAEALGWSSRPLMIEFDDGTLIFASRDDEGNGAGSLLGQTPDGTELTFPVL